MHLPTYLMMLSAAEHALGSSYTAVAAGHRADSDVHYPCREYAEVCTRHEQSLAPIVDAYRERRLPAPDRLLPSGLEATRTGPVGMLRDLQDLYQLASLVEITWELVGQAASGARDRALIDVVATCRPEVGSQLGWLRTRMRAAAPQTLLVAS